MAFRTRSWLLRAASALVLALAVLLSAAPRQAPSPSSGCFLAPAAAAAAISGGSGIGAATQSFGASAAQGPRGGRGARTELRGLGRPLEWLRSKLAGLRTRRPRASTYDAMILEPMLARIEQTKSGVGGGGGAGGGGASSAPGTYESVVLEPMLTRIVAAN